MATLIAATGVVTAKNAHVIHRSDVSAAYKQLLRDIEIASPEEKSMLEPLLYEAIAEARIDSIGHYFLGSGLIRVIPSNPSYWEVTSATNSPRPELLARLDHALEAMSPGRSPYAVVGAGIQAFVSGSDDIAYGSFYRAAVDPRFRLVVRDDFIGAKTCRPIPALATISDQCFPMKLGEVQWLQRDPVGTEPYVISYFCDDLYFRAFAPEIVSSLPLDASGLTLHFHIVNPGPASRELVSWLIGTAHDRHVSLQASFELTSVADRAYFASVRFIRMYAFLEDFQRAMLFLDVDSYFETDPRAWCGDFRSDAVNMLFCKGPWASGYVPWRAFWAGMVYVPFTPHGSGFAKLLKHVLAYLWTPTPHQNWFIDQNALYLTYQLIAHQGDNSGFANIPPERHRRLRHGEKFKHQHLEQLSRATPGSQRQKTQGAKRASR